MKLSNKPRHFAPRMRVRINGKLHNRSYSRRGLYGRWIDTPVRAQQAERHFKKFVDHLQ